MPAADKLPSVLRDRAVANTLQPCAANSKANALPAPPSEHLFRMLAGVSCLEHPSHSGADRKVDSSGTHPVMRTLRFCTGDMVLVSSKSRGERLSEGERSRDCIFYPGMEEVTLPVLYMCNVGCFG